MQSILALDAIRQMSNLKSKLNLKVIVLLFNKKK